MSSSPSYMTALLSRDKDARELFFSYAGNRSLSCLVGTCHTFRNFAEIGTCAEYKTNGRKAVELVSYVVNPTVDNLARMEAFLDKHSPAVQLAIMLTRVSVKEEYISKGKTKCKKQLPPLSSLEAAILRCGDPYVLNRLLQRLRHCLAVVPQNAEQAIAHLQHAQAQCRPEIPGNYRYDLDCLLKAYRALLTPYEALKKVENWSEIDRLNGCMGNTQFNLSWFLLQIFCNPVPHEPIPDFKKEPERTCIVFCNEVLDLGFIGSEHSSALFKGSMNAPQVDMAVGTTYCYMDLLALERLYEVLPSQINEVIESFVRNPIWSPAEEAKPSAERSSPSSP